MRDKQAGDAAPMTADAARAEAPERPGDVPAAVRLGGLQVQDQPPSRRLPSRT